MTEKSEDQVIYYCNYCSGVNQKCTHSACTGNFEPYIPHSQYLALKSDLAVAVVALENIIKHQKMVGSFNGSLEEMSTTIRIAKEALGKIGEKK